MKSEETWKRERERGEKLQEEGRRQQWEKRRAGLRWWEGEEKSRNETELSRVALLRKWQWNGVKRRKKIEAGIVNQETIEWGTELWRRRTVLDERGVTVRRRFPIEILYENRRRRELKERKRKKSLVDVSLLRSSSSLLAFWHHPIHHHHPERFDTRRRRRRAKCELGNGGWRKREENDGKKEKNW